eukprot:6886363-Ditylum_brightwellii.AAC.2
MDSLCLFCLNSAVLNNDAKACYDRMIPEVISLHLQSLGLPPVAIKCSMLLNKNMSHHVKMPEGILAESYKHTDTFTKYGERQGKASSLSNWLFQSLTILNALHALASSIFLVSKVYI